MDTKSKKLLVTIVVLMGISILVTFYRTVVVKDYPVITPSETSK